MNNDSKLKNSMANIKRSLTEHSEYSISVCGLEFIAHPNVFSPQYFKSTEILTKAFPFCKNEKFLEIGCGIGVACVVASKKWDNYVIGTDINPNAIDISIRNAAHNEVEKNASFFLGDLFEPVKDMTFDTIYWDMPYVYSDVCQKEYTILERAVVDPGYKSISKFIKTVHNYIKPSSRIILGFGSNGDSSKFNTIIMENNYSINVLFKERIKERDGIEYCLLEVVV